MVEGVEGVDEEAGSDGHEAATAEVEAVSLPTTDVISERQEEGTGREKAAI